MIRTRMFLVRNVRVAMRKLPRFQGQTFKNVNSRMTIDQTKTFALGNVAVSIATRMFLTRNIRVRITRVQAQSENVVFLSRFSLMYREQYISVIAFEQIIR